MCFIGLEGADFSELRLAGLRRVFDDAGLKGAIQVLAIPTRADSPRHSEELLTPDDRAELARIHQHIGSWMSLSDQARRLPLPTDHQLSALSSLTQFLSFASYRKDTVPLIRSALAIPGLSAIVAAYDSLALNGVMPLLAHERLRIPQDLSVVSFNGSFEAFQAGLSSYQFDIAGMVMRMLDCVIAPQRGRPTARGRRFPVNGVLIRRPSLGLKSIGKQLPADIELMRGQEQPGNES
jgi:hypothetical protein